jgi:hypothetical protein
MPDHHRRLARDTSTTPPAMTVKAAKFTPEVLLSSPRRSPGIPNRSGSLILYTVSTYSFEKHTKTIQARTFDIASETSRLVGEFASFADPAWVSDSEFIFLVPKDDGSTKLFVVDVEARDQCVWPPFLSLRARPPC